VAKKKRDVGKEILQGIREIKRGVYGRVINVPDIAKTREKTGLSQARFAELLGVSVRTLQDWEQGAASPFRGCADPTHDCREKPASLARSRMSSLASHLLSGPATTSASAKPS
jgi:putative transcriptional regulator